MDDVRRLIHLPEELLFIIIEYLSFQDCILLHEVNKLLNSIFHQFMIMKYKGIKKDFRNKDRLPMVQFYHLVKVYISNLSQLDIVFSNTEIIQYRYYYLFFCGVGAMSLCPVTSFSRNRTTTSTSIQRVILESNPVKEKVMLNKYCSVDCFFAFVSNIA
jgi:hypothetical protein